jgi:hypothetical protein
MAGRTQDKLLETFAEASGGGVATLRTMLDSAADMASTSGTGEQNAAPGGAGAPGAAALYGASANPVGSNAQALPLSSGATNDTGSTVGSIASTFFESGFGMAALVKGLVGLFEGGNSTPAPLEKYEMPPAIDFESADSATGMSAADYDQTGAPRAAGSPGGAGTGSPTSGTSPQVTVNVQAMDAQSFLDHSDAIAQAVRGAMLSMSSINDVVNEL